MANHKIQKHRDRQQEQSEKISPNVAQVIKDLPIQNVRQSYLSNNPWNDEYSSHAEYCSGCNTDNLHTHIKTGKKSCACCGAC